jgi:phospholipid/cholesterol/gamma-HCH transport system substrate-binding protein
VRANAAALTTPAYGDIGPIGSANELGFVNVVAAPLMQSAPRDVPPITDLLLGPLLRGTAVSLG